MADIVKLNVGGVHYTTTRSTLTTYPDSMLGAMFSGSMPLTLDSDGRYFLDRNGAMFSYILDFLRTSTLAVPAGFKLFNQLKLEADFYEIEPLIMELQTRTKMKPGPQGNMITIVFKETPKTNGNPLGLRADITGATHVLTHLITCLREHRVNPYYHDIGEPELVGASLSLQFSDYFSKHSIVELLHESGGKLQGYGGNEHEHQIWLMPNEFSQREPLAPHMGRQRENRDRRGNPKIGSNQTGRYW